MIKLLNNKSVMGIFTSLVLSGIVSCKPTAMDKNPKNGIEQKETPKGSGELTEKDMEWLQKNSTIQQQQFFHWQHQPMQVTYGYNVGGACYEELGDAMDLILRSRSRNYDLARQIESGPLGILFSNEFVNKLFAEKRMNKFVLEHEKNNEERHN